jgi:tetratricopeptide (TPR) repeat protein
MQLKIGENTQDAELIAKAKFNFNQTLNISNENEYGNGKLYGFEGLGQIAISEKKYDEAKAIYTKMDSLSRALKNTPIIGISNLKLGIIALEEANYNEGKTKLFIAEGIIEASDVEKDKAQLYSALNQYYIETSNFKEAHHYLELQKKIEDTLSSKNLQDKISNYKIKYQTEKKKRKSYHNALILQKKNCISTKKTRNLLGFLY